MKKLLFCVFLLAVALFAGSPYYTSYKLHQAYQNDDGQHIANSIDYANLQYNLNTQLSTRLEETMQKYPLVNQFAGNALSIGVPFIKTAINGAITPDNITNAISSKGQINEASKQLAVAWAIATDKVDVTSLVQDILTQPKNAETLIKEQLQNRMAEQQSEGEYFEDESPELSYCGINCFNITTNIKGYPVTVNMQRQSFIKWKIINIQLP